MSEKERTANKSKDTEDCFRCTNAQRYFHVTEITSSIGDRKFSLWVRFCVRLWENQNKTKQHKWYLPYNYCFSFLYLLQHSLQGCLTSVFPQLSEFLLPLTFLRGAMLDSDLPAQACHSKADIFINTYKTQIYDYNDHLWLRLKLWHLGQLLLQDSHVILHS